MIVTHLSLTDFRNYETADVAMVAGPNLFVGRNGQGKTNLVESLGYLSTLGSHRVSSDQAMIRQGKDSAIVRARLFHADREVLAELQLNRSGANRAQINRSAIRTRDLPGISRACCSRPRIWRSCEASHPAVAGSSTSCSCSAPRGLPVC